MCDESSRANFDGDKELDDLTETDAEPQCATAKEVAVLGNVTISNEGNKKSNLQNRIIWSIILIMGYGVILAAGHFYCSLLVLVSGVGVYKEIISLRQDNEKDKKLPLFFLQKWYWFGVTMLATGSVWMFPMITPSGSTTARFGDMLITHHALLTYISVFIGLIFFIVSLRRFYLRYQFSQFTMLLLTCILVVGPGMLQIANIYSGLIWFILSTSCVMINDIFAYIFGVCFGKTRLIRLSPNKTVEGFVGASLVTILWALMLSTMVSYFPPLYCPQHVVTFKTSGIFSQHACDVPSAFTLRHLPLPSILGGFTGDNHKYIGIRPVQFHGLVIGIFVAFFAPFGGFFASGLKRALRIKDFGHSIPGHGGFTDRVDCQILTGVFTYIYLHTFVNRRDGEPTLELLLQHIHRLPLYEQYQLLNEMTTIIAKN